MNSIHVKASARRITATLSILIAFFLTAGHCYSAGKPAAAQGTDFYASTVLPAMNKIKKAMPSPPAGWVVADETQSDFPQRSASAPSGPFLHIVYQIRYKRITGMREENNKLNEVYRESSERNGAAAKSRIEELLKQQTITSLALRKAVRRKKQAAVDRLNNELDENGRKMRAIHEEVDEKISADVAPYLIKDAEAVMRVEVNGEVAEVGGGETLSAADGAFAFRREGEQTAPAVWKEGRTVLLYGKWQQSLDGVSRAQLDRTSAMAAKAQTVSITLIGAKTRTEGLLKQLDKKSILTLMK